MYFSADIIDFIAHHVDHEDGEEVPGDTGALTDGEESGHENVDENDKHAGKNIKNPDTSLLERTAICKLVVNEPKYCLEVLLI